MGAVGAAAARLGACGIPCGGIIATPEVASFLKPGTHASTYGGNPVSSIAALATVATIEEDGLLERAKVLEGKFRARFEALAARATVQLDNAFYAESRAGRPAG